MRPFQCIYERTIESILPSGAPKSSLCVGKRALSTKKKRYKPIPSKSVDWERASRASAGCGAVCEAKAQAVARITQGYVSGHSERGLGRFGASASISRGAFYRHISSLGKNFALIA